MAKTRYMVVTVQDAPTLPTEREKLANVLAGALEDAGYGFCVKDAVWVTDQSLTLNIDLADACAAIMEAIV